MERDLILGILVPALIGAGGAALAWRPWRTGDDRIGTWAGGLILAVAYVAGHAAISGWPPLFPSSATHGLPHLAALGAIAGAATLLRQGKTGWAFRILCCAAIPWLLFSARIERWSTGDTALWLVLGYVGFFAWWTGLDVLGRRLAGRQLVVLLGIVIAAMAGVFVLSQDVRSAQLAGVLGCALAGVALVVWIRPARSPLAATVPLLAVLLVAMLAIQHTDIYGNVPRTATGALLLAPLSALAVTAGRSAGPIAGARGWLALVPPAVCSIAAVAFAQSEASSLMYGY